MIGRLPDRLRFALLTEMGNRSATRDYFVVKAREGDPNAALAWWLSDIRKGYSRVRLEQVEQ